MSFVKGTNTKRKEGIEGKKLKEIVNQQNKQLGVLVYRKDRKEFSFLYNKSIDKVSFDAFMKKSEKTISNEFTSSLDKEVGIFIAGTAGERVQLSSYLLLYVIITSDDGLREITANGMLSRCTDETILMVDTSSNIQDIKGKVVKLPVRQYERVIQKRFCEDAETIIRKMYELTDVKFFSENA